MLVSSKLSHQVLDGLLEDLALLGELLLSLLCQLALPPQLCLLDQQGLVLDHHQLHLQLHRHLLTFCMSAERREKKSLRFSAFIT